MLESKQEQVCFEFLLEESDVVYLSITVKQRYEIVSYHCLKTLDTIGNVKEQWNF